MGGAGAQYSQRSQESQWVSGLFSAHAVRAACGSQGFILPQRLGVRDWGSDFDDYISVGELAPWNFRKTSLGCETGRWEKISISRNGEKI